MDNGSSELKKKASDNKIKIIKHSEQTKEKKELYNISEV
jgi:hypothetical protein